MNPGLGIGLNVKLPQQEVEAAGQPKAGTQASRGIPEQEGPNFDNFMKEGPSGLQYTHELTKEVYDKWAALQGIAYQANAMGIDVTRPNMFDPEAQKLYTTYQQGVADLRYSADVLKNSQKIHEEAQKLQLKGEIGQRPGADIGEQPMSMRNTEDLFYSKSDTSIVEGAQNAYQKYDFKTEKDYTAALSTWEEQKKKLTESLNSQNLPEEYKSEQLAKYEMTRPSRVAYDKPTPPEKPQKLTPGEEKHAGGAEFLKSIANVLAGGSPNQTQIEKVAHGDGSMRYLLTTTEFNGMNLTIPVLEEGEYIDKKVSIEKITRDPLDGATTLYFNNDKAVTIESLGWSAMDFAQNLIKSGNNVGINVIEMTNIAKKEGWLDEGGSFLQHAVLQESYLNKARLPAEGMAQIQQQVVNKLKREMEEKITKTQGKDTSKIWEKATITKTIEDETLKFSDGTLFSFNVSEKGGATTYSISDSTLDKLLPISVDSNITGSDRIRAELQIKQEREKYKNMQTMDDIYNTMSLTGVLEEPISQAMNAIIEQKEKERRWAEYMDKEQERKRQAEKWLQENPDPENSNGISDALRKAFN